MDRNVSICFFEVLQENSIITISLICLCACLFGCEVVIAGTTTQIYPLIAANF